MCVRCHCERSEESLKFWQLARRRQSEIFRAAQHARERKRFNDLLRLQHESKVDALAFSDVETIDCKESPACRWGREEFARYGRRQNNKTRIGCAHELRSATLV